MAGIGSISQTSVPISAPPRPPVKAEAAGATSQPQESFTPSNPQVTGSWLTGQLKNQKPGAMFVLDDFQPTGGQAIPGPFAGPEWMASHGGQVIDTAKKEGFQGNTIPLEINRPLSDQQRQQMYGPMNELWENGKTGEDYRKSLYERAVVNRTGTLDNATTSLDDLSAAGAHDSVVNLSASVSQAATVSNLLSTMVPADPNNPASVSASQADQAKYAAAFGIPVGDLNNSDPAVSGPARQKLYQGMVDLVGQTQSDPRFVEAKAEYGLAVDHFEAGNNSVVVASGNDGIVQPFLEQKGLGNGLKLRSSPEFTQNDLGVNNATVVGATRNWEGTPYPAEYNNKFAGVDMYANGYAGDGTPKPTEGSSFAAPRVGAAMAALHGLKPGTTSSQVETLMRNQLTGKLPNYWGASELPTLDEKHTVDFLQQGTF